VLKLPSIVVFKRKSLIRANFPNGVVVKTNEKGWMDEKLIKFLLKDHVGSSIYHPQ
jgi:hypothetical protein